MYVATIATAIVYHCNELPFHTYRYSFMSLIFGQTDYKLDM